MTANCPDLQYTYKIRQADNAAENYKTVALWCKFTTTCAVAGKISM